MDLGEAEELQASQWGAQHTAICSVTVRDSAYIRRLQMLMIAVDAADVGKLAELSSSHMVAHNCTR